MHTIEKEIKAYLTQTKSFLICDSKLKKSIISEIEESIYEYAENNGISDISQIYERFGTPEETARTYLNQADPKLLKSTVSINRIIIYTAVIALIIFCLFLIAVFIDAHIDFNGYATETIIVGTTEILTVKIL